MTDVLLRSTTSLCATLQARRAVVKLALAKDFIRSLELHTMTFTGHNGQSFDRAGRYTTFEVLSDIEAQTYVLRLDVGRWLPFPQFMPGSDLGELLGGMLYLEPSVAMEHKLADVINRLWAGEIAYDDPAPVLAKLRALTDAVFERDLGAAERLRRAEASAKAIYVHAHMDEETFDTDRIRQCCVGIREPDGTNIPSCAYNTLDRDRDARFAAKPAPPLIMRGRGRH